MNALKGVLLLEKIFAQAERAKRPETNGQQFETRNEKKVKSTILLNLYSVKSVNKYTFG